MRAAVVTDLHVCQDDLPDRYGTPGQQALLDQLANQITVARPEVILVGGDLAGQRVPHKALPAERNAVVEFLRSLADVAPVVIVRGNHDYPRDWQFLNYLHATNPIVYVERDAASSGEVVQVGDWEVIALPWIDRTEFPIGSDYAAEVDRVYRQVIMEVVAADEDVPRIVLAHAAVNGGMIRDGQPIVPIADPLLDPNRLCCHPSIKAVFLGHYHLRQRVKANGLVVYPGSTFVSQFSEDAAKGWALYDSEAEAGQEVVYADLPQVPRVTLEVDGVQGRITAVVPPVLDTIRAGDPIGGFVCPTVRAHIKVRVRGAISMTQAKQLAEVVVGVVTSSAVSVRTEFDLDRVARAREGADEVAAATSTTEKVREYLARVKPTVSGGRIKRTLDLLREAEKELDGQGVQNA